MGLLLLLGGALYLLSRPSSPSFQVPIRQQATTDATRIYSPLPETTASGEPYQWLGETFWINR